MRKLLLIFMMLCATTGFAQRAAVSTDAVKWALASPNVSASVAVTSRLTLDVELSANPFSELYSDCQFTHVAVSPELLYWFDRPYYAHSVGVNLLGTTYDLRCGERFAKGRMAAVGLVYGYGFILGERWALTPTIGVGFGAIQKASTSEIKYQPTLTKFGVNFSYIID